MMSPTTSPSQTAARAPGFTAIIPYRRYAEITLTQLITALRSIAPGSVMGDWAGPFTAPPTDALGTGMLSIDGVSLTLLNVDRAMPPEFFVSDPIPNQLLPNAPEKLRDHRAHVAVMKAGKPVGRAASIATARAVTLLTWAVAVVVQAEAFKWDDANNVVPVSELQRLAPMLRSAGGRAVPVWVRFLAGRTHGQQKIMAGTYGLWAFDLPEIEYAPTDLPIRYLTPHTYMVSDFLLRSTNPIGNGDTIDVDGESVFRVETLERGFFTKGPALRLSWLEASSRRLGRAKS
jgi:hypothetical protein